MTISRRGKARQRRGLVAGMAILLGSWLLARPCPKAGAADAVRIEGGATREPVERLSIAPPPRLAALLHSRNQRPAGPGWDRFRAENGPDWDVWLDLAAGRPLAVVRAGPPGAAVSGEQGPLDLAELEAWATKFLARHEALLGIDPQALRFRPDRSVVLAADHLAVARFEYRHRGLPVDGAYVYLDLVGGRLRQWGMVGVSEVDLDVTPRVDEGSASRLALAALSRTSPRQLTSVEGPSLEIVYHGGVGEVGTENSRYAHALVWRLELEEGDPDPAGGAVGGPGRSWEVLIDAHQGTLLRLRDLGRQVEGVVSGGVYPFGSLEGEVERPMPWLQVEAALPSPPPVPAPTYRFTTDDGGRYFPSWTGVTLATTHLTGDTVCVYDQACCTSPPTTLCSYGTPPPGSPSRCQLPDDVCLNNDCASPCYSLRCAPPTTMDIALGSGGATGPGGTDCDQPPGQPAYGFYDFGNTRAARTSYFHLQYVRQIALGYLPGNLFLTGFALDLKTNGFWYECTSGVSGASIVTFQSCNLPGGRACPGVVPRPPWVATPYACRNTGEFSGDIAHELGHLIDDNDGTFPNLSAESYPDAVALLESRDPCLSRGLTDVTCGNCFRTSACSGRRDASLGTTPTSIGLSPNTPYSCQPSGPCCNPGGGSPASVTGYEGHAEPVIPVGALWDMVERFRQLLLVGPWPLSPDAAYQTAWIDAQRIFFKAAVLGMSDPFRLSGGARCAWTGTDGCDPVRNWYTRFLEADDNDANPVTTPHATQIWEAFNRHEIACGRTAPNSSGCPRLAPPVVTVADGANSATVTWTAVPGATAYHVYRGKFGCHRGMARIAVVGSASPRQYVDPYATDGFPYAYVVQAEVTTLSGASTCYSAASECQGLGDVCATAAGQNPCNSAACGPRRGEGGRCRGGCGDGIDNDCDGLVDEDCACLYSGPESCGDGVDNDCDGLSDCADPDCATRPGCAGCGDGVCAPPESCETCSIDCASWYDRCEGPDLLVCCGDGRRDAAESPQLCDGNF